MGNLVLNIAAAQVARGHDVTVCGFSDPFPAGCGSWRGVDIIALRRWNWARLSRNFDASLLLPSFKETIKHRPIDILHIHEIGLLYLPFARRRVMHLNIPLQASAGASHLWKRADAVLCCSGFVRNAFLTISDYPAERTYVAYNGASMTLLAEEQVLEARQALGLRSSDVLVLFVGALVPEKGADVLIRALASLNRDGRARTIKTFIVGGSKLWRVRGDTAEVESYEARLIESGGALNVQFTGLLTHAELFPLYQACDIVVVPSVCEDSHPLVVSEAMAAGKPIIASAVGGISETVLDGQTGLLVRPNDHGSLAESILLLATNDELRQRMGAAALERSTIFSWKATAATIDRVYGELLEE
jgi:glycosyltransferase involved in cell wall biosynthesis